MRALVVSLWVLSAAVGQADSSLPTAQQGETLLLPGWTQPVWFGMPRSQLLAASPVKLKTFHDDRRPIFVANESLTGAISYWMVLRVDERDCLTSVQLRVRTRDGLPPFWRKELGFDETGQTIRRNLRWSLTHQLTHVDKDALDQYDFDIRPAH